VPIVLHSQHSLELPVLFLLTSAISSPPSGSYRWSHRCWCDQWAPFAQARVSLPLLGLRHCWWAIFPLKHCVFLASPAHSLLGLVAIPAWWPSLPPPPVFSSIAWSHAVSGWEYHLKFGDFQIGTSSSCLSLVC
jgi:hypothetical protein